MAESVSHLLVVDDDPLARTILEGYFQNEGFRVSLAENGAAMKKILQGHDVDVILLDINLTDREDGLVLTRELRAHSNVGIILVTSRSSDVDRIVGLELGADDYVVKPYNERELLARVKGLIRRLSLQDVVADEVQVFSFDGWVLELETRRLLSPSGADVEITHGEYLLLRAFLRRPGWILNRDQLMEAISNREWSPSDRTVDVMVGRLRRKIESDPAQPQILRTVHGAGYQFNAKVSRLR